MGHPSTFGASIRGMFTPAGMGPELSSVPGSAASPHPAGLQ